MVEVRTLIVIVLLGVNVGLIWYMHREMRKAELMPRESEEKRLRDRLKLYASSPQRGDEG